MGTRLPLKLLLTISLLLILQGGADAATVFGGKSSPPAVTEWPMPQRTPVSHWVGATPGSSSKGGLVEISPAKPEARKLKWRFGIHYFQGTANDLGEVLTGQCDTISQNGIRLSAGVVLVEDLCDWPIDILARAGIMWHNEQSAQDDLLQYSLAIEFELKKFPWSDHLRTRAGFATGFSYAEHIPTAEILNRGSTSSKHLLHYLEIKLAFNCEDIFRLTRLDHLLTGIDPETMDNFWLVASVPHRSGAWGLYGNDRNGDAVTGGSNYLSIGIEGDF